MSADVPAATAVSTKRIMRESNGRETPHSAVPILAACRLIRLSLESETYFGHGVVDTLVDTLDASRFHLAEVFGNTPKFAAAVPNRSKPGRTTASRQG